jgi:hypothetical protein
MPQLIVVDINCRPTAAAAAAAAASQLPELSSQAVWWVGVTVAGSASAVPTADQNRDAANAGQIPDLHAVLPRNDRYFTLLHGKRWLVTARELRRERTKGPAKHRKHLRRRVSVFESSLCLS